MNNQEWQKVESIFHAALNLTGRQRVLYLSEACSGNDSLFSEVNSLISAFEQKSEFLEEPVFSLGMTVLDHSQEKDLTGQTIGCYRIEKKLGGGGMGDVYLAEDTRLNRKVALKFLKDNLLNDRWAKRQFIREAQAFALLEHQNICAVHSIEEIDGHNFIVMQYIEGQTLSAYLDGRQLSADEVISITRQIIDALSVAHSHNIIHRDIKPGNIIITPDKQVKVLDFGLAKIIQQKQKSDYEEAPSTHISQNGLILGTVAYMSPEQLRAEKLDYRSDIFSAGIVIYEMLSKHNPFSRKSQAETIAAILDNEPVPFKEIVPQYPNPFVLIVRKCLNKDKEKRFQSAVELLVELDKLKDSPETNSFTHRVANWRKAAALNVLFLVLATMLFFYLYSNNNGMNFAVLPIANESNDASNDYLSEGLTENLIGRLSKFKRLRTKAATIVARYKGQNINPQQAGKELGVEMVLLGKIIRRADSVLLAVSLVNTSDGSQIWSRDYHIEGNDLEISQMDLTNQIVSKLKVALTESENQQLTKQPPVDAEARRHYFSGRYFWNNRNKDNIQKAVWHFEKAIDIEPSYAQAWTGLADAYIVMTTPAYGSLTVKDATSKAKAALLKSIEFDDSLCETYTSLGSIKLRYEWDWAGAEENFLKAIDLNPDYAQAHYSYSSLLVLKRQFEKAMSEAEKARDLDPLSPMYNLHIARVFYYSGRNDRALPIYTQYFNDNPTNRNAAYMLSLALIQNGDYNNALDILQRFYDTDREYFAAPLGYAYGKVGRKDDALRILNDLDQLSTKKNIPAQEKAIIYLGLDDKDKAFDQLNRSCEERFPPFPFLLVDSLLDKLRTDRRFSELKKCVSLPA